MSELLLELLCEELPLWAQCIGGRELNEHLATHLKKLGFWQEQTSARSFATPRRLCLTVSDLATEIPPRQERRRGPRKNAPEKAIGGFCESVGIKRAFLKEEGDYLYAILESPGERLGDALARIIPEAIGKIGWKKSMRWGDGEVRFPRPLRSILCLVDGDVVDFKIADIRSGAHTCGHRFMSPNAFKVKGFADYEKKLSDNKVILDSQERIDRIIFESKKLSRRKVVRLNENEFLLAEIAALSECPVPVLCGIGEGYMDLPDEVLREVIEGQQKYLTTSNKDGDTLAPFCIAIADIEAEDGCAAIRRGNERVLHARLSDADFFYKRDLEKWKQEDSRKKLLQELQGITFYNQVTMSDKVEGIRDVAGVLCRSFPSLSHADDGAKPILYAKEGIMELMEEMADLAKLDLASEMVREFPRLQGIMGSEYISRIGVSKQNKNFEKNIIAAVREQYQPQSLEDSIPKTELGQCLSLADKFLTLISLWSDKNTHPSGAGDSHGLRRAALGIIRILLEGRIHYPIIGDQTRDLNRICPSHFKDQPDCIDSLFRFFIERLKVYLRQRKGLRPDVVDAALPGSGDLLQIYYRAEALAAYFPDTADGKAVLKGYKRAANILRDESSVFSPLSMPVARLLQERAEKNLHHDIADAEKDIIAAMAADDYKRAVKVCASLREPIDDFFDRVRVNVDDERLRKNRLQLLRYTKDTLEKVADFSRISDK